MAAGDPRTGLHHSESDVNGDGTKKAEPRMKHGQNTDRIKALIRALTSLLSVFNRCFIRG